MTMRLGLGGHSFGRAYEAAQEYRREHVCKGCTQLIHVEDGAYADDDGNWYHAGCPKQEGG